MSNEVQSANAGADQKPVVKNISSSEFRAARYKAMTEAMKAQKPPEQPKEQPQEVVPSEPEKPKEEAVQEEPIPAPEDNQDVKEQKVLSKDVDLENMSEAELKELAQKLGSKAVARFGELTAKRKQAEEQLASLQAELAKRSSNQLEAKVKDNPYANIDKPEELQAKFQEVSEVIDWADDLLEKGEDLGAEDVLTNVNGKDYTKREIKEALRKARKAKEVFLPDQDKQIKIAAERKNFREALTERAKTELPWLQGEDNDVRKQYEAMLSDERLKNIEKMLPDVAPQLPYLLAHAANSIYARRAVDTKPSSRLSPPSPVVSQSAESSKPETRQSKALQDLSTRFNKSGSYKDFKAIRALQLSR
jgi:hypothetical protein